jgi:hemoglobin
MDPKLSRRNFVEAAVVGLAATAVPLAAMPVQAAPSGSLYARLGGYDAIAAVTDDFIGRLAKDPALGKFFVGLSVNSQQRVRQLVVDQICAAAGGPCIYLGRDMKTVHKGLGITGADWTKAVGHFTATLEKFKVPAKERDELLAMVSKLKTDIVEKP